MDVAGIRFREAFQEQQRISRQQEQAALWASRQVAEPPAPKTKPVCGRCGEQLVVPGRSAWGSVAEIHDQFGNRLLVHAEFCMQLEDVEAWQPVLLEGLAS